MSHAASGADDRPLILPAPLSATSLIAIATTAGPVVPEDLDVGLAMLSSHWKILDDDRWLQRDGFLAGADAIRADVLQRGLDHPAVGAVIAARGGFGTSRILDRLDLSTIPERPRWIVGSSDLTALLLQLWNDYRLITIHGPMAARFPHGRQDDFDCLVSLLSGVRWTPPRETLELEMAGEAEGFFIGGNLCVMSHMAGSLPVGAFHDAILFIEEVAEAPYRIDRMLTQLARSGYLKTVRGVVLGDFTRCDPGPDGMTAKEVLHRHLCDRGIPVISGYPGAHGGRNWPFLHGARVQLCALPGEPVRLELSR